MVSIHIPPCEKDEHLQKNTLSGDMLVPSRVIKNDIDSISFAGIVKLHTLNGNNSFGKKKRVFPELSPNVFVFVKICIVVTLGSVTNLA